MDCKPARPCAIHQLSPSVVNKIAAGEVIERPASVVKELLENAVDAGATRIDVTVGQGGVELVRVVDNGCGIAADQLPLAVAPHATSKITSMRMIYFASARSAFAARRWPQSPKSARSCSAAARPRPKLARNSSCTAATRSPLSPCGCSEGTTVEVHNLFFNTPVRRKFLRTAQTELGHAGEAFTRIALAHLHIHFTLRGQEKTIYDLPSCDDWTERIAALFAASWPNR